MVQGARFRLLGFPVTIRPGFVLIIALIAFLYGGELGPWLAGALAAFTLVHELGHALAARRFGATAAIALDLLDGYASYVPSRPLARWERALIAVAGPAIEIGVGVAVLLLMGANPLSLDSVRESPGPLRHLVGGPVIGLVNLVPALPLDGGTIASLGIDRILPGRGRLYMTYFSLGAGRGRAPRHPALPDLAAVDPDRRAHRGQQLPGAAPPSPCRTGRDDSHERMLAAAARRRGAGLGQRTTGVLPARRAPVAVVPGAPAAPGRAARRGRGPS